MIASTMVCFECGTTAPWDSSWECPECGWKPPNASREEEAWVGVDPARTGGLSG